LAGAHNPRSKARKLERLTIPTGANLRLAVVADTHSKPHPRVGELLRSLGPHAVLHAGDIGELRVLHALRELCPVLAVRGNIDSPVGNVPDVLVLELSRASVPALRILLTHIALDGPTLRADAVRLARAEEASLIVCGHSHVPFIGQDRGLTVFNPGSAGPRRFSLPIVLGLMEVSERDVRMSHIDCETGLPWHPPKMRA
jgi:putative phosphoesterase